MHEIVEIVNGRHTGLLFTFGFAVAFPDSKFEGQIPASTQRELILDADRLGTVSKSIQTVFRRFARRSHRAMHPREVESIRAALFPKYKLVPVLWRRIEDQEERLQRLTEDQQRILDILARRSSAAISGVAGSGKALLALAKAQAMAQDGMRTLFLCYNRPLREWLRQAMPRSFGDSLVIDHYHGLANSFCESANVPLWRWATPRTARSGRTRCRTRSCRRRVGR